MSSICFHFQQHYLNSVLYIYIVNRIHKLLYLFIIFIYFKIVLAFGIKNDEINIFSLLQILNV
jgi:hypothetical protein